MKTASILGVHFHAVTMQQAVELAMSRIRARQKGYVVTPNPEIVDLCCRDSEYMGIVNRATLVLPDGIGVIKGAAMLGTPLKERTPGVEFATHLMDKLAEEGKSLYLLGAKPGVAEQAGAKLAAAHPGLRIAGTHDGYFKEDGPVVAAIRQSGADVVFVCLGAPKQEKWIARFGLLTGAKMAIGLGGALDVFAGNVERAPEKKKMGMEWAYRLSREPKRFGRMAKLPLVLVKAAGQRVTGRRRPGVL